MSTEIKLIIAACVLAFLSAAGWAVVHTYNSAIEERDAARQKAADLQVTIDTQASRIGQLKEENVALLSAQKTRQETERGIQKALDERDAKYRSYANDPSTRDWYNTELPLKLQLAPEETGTAAPGANVLRAPALPSANREAPAPTPRQR